MTGDTQQALSSIIGGTAAQALNGLVGATITGDGAIDLSVNGPDVTMLTKGSAAAITIAAPTIPGQVRRIISDTAFAHVITFTGNTLRGGTAAVATATCAAQKGAGITVFSLLPNEAAWGVLANVACTLATILLAVLLWAAPAAAQSAPAASAGTSLAWDIAAPSLADVQGYTWKLYADSAPAAPLGGVTCTGPFPNQTSMFTCTAPMPAFTPGAHSLTVTATNMAGEGPKPQLPFDFVFVALPAAPSNFRLVKAP